MRERERQTDRQKERKRERKRDRETLLTSLFLNKIRKGTPAQKKYPTKKKKCPASRAQGWGAR
jgi:hypothetical protein